MRYPLLIFLLFINFYYLIAAPSLTYHVRMEKPQTHYFNMEMHVGNNEDEVLAVKMAAWTPGSYMIRDYAGQVDRLLAEDKEGNPLPVEKVDKNTWEVKAGKVSDLILRYNVYAFEQSVRNPFLDASHAAIIGAGLFMYLADHDVPSTIHIHPPEGWNNISTGLDPVGDDPFVLHAPNKDILFDSPIEVGNHTILEFEAAGIPHYIAIYGEGNYESEEKLTNDIAAVVEATTAIFGDNPCEDYTFILHNTADSYGGLEHLNSTSLIYRRWGYQPDSRYHQFLGLVSHEYFHLWNIKRIRPEALSSFNYDEEQYTPFLWVAEGFTSYYDDLILRRAGLLTTEEYLNRARGNINNIMNTVGDNYQPVAHASFDAWIKYYRQNENSYNCCVSYYSKGAVLAMLLDLEILHVSKGKKRLDDFLRDLYELYKKDPSSGYSEKEFKKLLRNYLGDFVDGFFEKYVYGTEDPDYQRYFDYVGLRIGDFNEGVDDVRIGISVRSNNTIRIVRRNSAAWEGGLNAGDEILAVDGYRFNGEFGHFTRDKEAGDPMTFLISRDGKIMEITIELQKTDRVRTRLIRSQEPTEEQKELFKTWLSTDSYY